MREDRPTARQKTPRLEGAGFQDLAIWSAVYLTRVRPGPLGRMVVILIAVIRVEAARTAIARPMRPAVRAQKMSRPAGMSTSVSSYDAKPNPNLRSRQPLPAGCAA